MKLILYDRLYLELAEISADHRMKMDKLFTPYNPKYNFEERSGRSTKGISKYLKMYEVSDEFYVLPIGILYKVLDFLDWYGYKYEIIDKRTEGKDIEFEFDDSVTLEDYQVDVVNALLNSKTSNGLVQAPPGSGKCIHKDSYIFTSNGLRKIHTLFTEEKISSETYHEISDTWIHRDDNKKVKASHVYFDGFRKTKKLITKNGYTLEGTLDHPVKVNTGGVLQWKKLSEIEVGDYLCIQRNINLWPTKGSRLPKFNYTSTNGATKKNVILPKVVSPSFARFLGYLIGDGNYSTKSTKIISFTNNDENLLEDFKACTSTLGLSTKEVIGKNNVRSLLIHSWVLREFLKEIGLEYVTSHNKCIPDCILTSPKKIVREFLRALFSCDGSSSVKGIEYTSTSKELIRQIQLLLLNFGIISISEEKKTSWVYLGLKKVSSAYRLRISGVEAHKYDSLIGFILDYKNKNHSKFTETNYDTVPCSTLMRGLNHYSKNNGFGRLEKRHRYYGKIMCGTSKPSYSHLRKLLRDLRHLSGCSEYAQLQYLVELDYYYSPVVLCTDGESEVYDLHVPDGNSFNAQGIVNHNTFLALNYISKIKKKTLIVVHENRLFDQWVQEIKRRGRGNYTLGVFNGSEHTFGDITLVLIQSGYRYKDAYPEFSEYGVVITDECHHSSASTGIFAKFLHNIPAKYKFGLSGTLKRKDGMDFVIEYFLGEKLIEIPESKTKNRITDFTVQFIDTKVSIDLPWNTRDGKPSYMIREKDGKKIQVKNYLRLKTHELLAAITGFQGHGAYPKDISDEDLITLGLSGPAGVRNRRIVDEIIADIKMGHFPLALTNRTMHAKFIFAYLKREGYNGVILTGETADNYDIAEIRDAPVSKGQRIHFIVASERIAAEALDITYLSCLHLLIPSQNQYKLKQCLGRIRRRASIEKLSPVVRDYVDRESGALPGEEDYFERSAKSRRYHYNKWKKEYAAP